MRKEIRIFIEDILKSIENIEEYVGEMNKEKFLEDNKTQDAVLRKLEVIGEAVKNIPSEVKDKYPEVSWKRIAGMRDIIIHEYFGINLERVWKTVRDDLPELKEKILKISEIET